MHKGGGISGDAIDGATERVEADTTSAEDGGGLTAGDGADERVDALTRQEAGVVVGFGVRGVALQLALRILAGQVALSDGFAVTTGLGHHCLEQGSIRDVVVGWGGTNPTDELL